MAQIQTHVEELITEVVGLGLSSPQRSSLADLLHRTASVDYRAHRRQAMSLSPKLRAHLPT